MGNQKRKGELERRRSLHKRTLVGVSVVVALGLVVGEYLFLIRDDDGPTIVTGQAETNSAEVFEGGPPILIYADFVEVQDMRRLDLESKDDQVALQLPRSGNTIAAYGSTWVTIDVAEEREDGGLQPVIYAFDTMTDQEIQLGIGLDPVWSPDGSKVAWAKAEDPADCGESRCRGDMIVTVTDPETGESSELGDPGPYSIVGWAGEYLIAQNDATPEQPILQSISPLGEIADLPLRPIDYWGASPDGRFIVESGELVATRFLEMADGRVTGEGDDIDIREGTSLGAGAWAHDSSAVAAFALGDDGREFVTFSPASPDPLTLAEGGEASTGITLWSPDNDAVVFQRFTGNEFEAVHCPIDDPDACDVVLSWTLGIALLRVE